MSINIGTEAVNAVVELRNSNDFGRLVSALGTVTQTRMLGSMSAPIEHRVDATAYARGMYDLWEALHAAYTGVQLSQVRPEPFAAQAQGNRRVKETANV